MAVYRDKKGHWVSKDEDNQECKHSGLAKGLGVEPIAEKQKKVFKYPSHVESQKHSLDDLISRGYEMQEVSIADLLNNDPGLSEAEDLGSYHNLIWGKEPDKFAFDENKVKDWGYSDGMYSSKKNGKITLGNGRHRTKALANAGYDAIEMPVKNEDLEDNLVKGLGLNDDDIILEEESKQKKWNGLVSAKDVMEHSDIKDKALAQKVSEYVNSDDMMTSGYKRKKDLMSRIDRDRDFDKILEDILKGEQK